MTHYLVRGTSTPPIRPINSSIEYKEHPGWGTGNSYDSLRLITDTVTSVGTDNKKVRGYLASVKDYSGASGKFSSSGDNRFTLPAALKKITEKGFEPLVASVSSKTSS